MATQLAEEKGVLGLDNPMGTDGFEFVEYTAPDTALLRDLFTKNVGKQLTSDQIRNAFDGAFGVGAGDRVRVSCLVDPSSGRRMIGELTLGLTGPIGPSSSLGALMLASAPTTKAGCPKGTVDPIGFQ